MMFWARLIVSGWVIAMATGCASLRQGEARSDAIAAASQWPSADRSGHARTAHGDQAGAWEHFKLPGKRATEFELIRVDGRTAMRATAASSASMLRQKLRIEPHELNRVLFSWKVPELIAQADMALREQDDAPVRVVLAFEGDMDKLSMRDRMLSEMALALTGEPMPYATLMYVWSNRRAPGTVIINPRTDRIRKLVVESGPVKLNRWLDYERDVRADFEKAFGEKPGALVGIGIMTDTDNTRSQARAWYGPLRLTRGTNGALPHAQSE